MAIAPGARNVQTSLSSRQLLDMDPSARARYFQSIPDAEARQAQMNLLTQAQVERNRMYLRNTVQKIAPCQVSSGGGYTQNWSAGQALNFTVVSAQNGFCTGLRIRFTLNVTFATGTSAVYAATAASPWSVIDTIQVLYNGTQSQFRPYILRQYAIMSGYQQLTWPNSVIAGNSISALTTYLNTGALPVSGSSQAFTYEFFVPFNALHPQDARGLLPIMGNDTQAQIVVTCAPQLLGNDPILNTWYAVSGSGHGITVNSGTVQVYADYRDGVSYLGPDLMPIDLNGLGTTQYQKDIYLNNITAGQIYRQKISIMDALYYVFITVVDGQQSNKFSTYANFASIELDRDSVGNMPFWKYGTGTNLSVYEYFASLRWLVGQDADEGVIPLIYAPSYGEADPSNMGGTHYLNTTMRGWTDVNYGLNLTAVNTVTGAPARVETHVIMVNSAGLIQA